MISIQEAAEKYYHEDKFAQSLHTHELTKQYMNHVTHYESLKRAAGYEWLKTEEWIRLHGELAGANEHIKLLENELETVNHINEQFRDRLYKDTKLNYQALLDGSFKIVRDDIPNKPEPPEDLIIHKFPEP